jgi:hypothetical protein
MIYRKCLTNWWAAFGTPSPRMLKGEISMYKLEVKRWLVEHKFPPKDGWEVRVEIDAMERAIGDQHKPDKKAHVKVAEDALISMQVTIESNTKYGPDILARHPQYGSYIGEVVGNSSKKKSKQLILHLVNKYCV